jgi:hypothetical protein
LEKEIKELTAAIKEEEDMRKKENDDYLAAKDEMTKAIAALQKAVDTMTAGTEGSFLHMSKGLKKALQVGKGFLAKKDIAALFQAAQPADVPDADWDKLNQEATFKQKYTKRSGEIQEILAEMLQTFTDNLAEAEAAEKKAAGDSSKLLQGKNDALSTAQTALRDQAGENGARGESKADSEEQKRDMEGQNTRDEGYIGDTQASCATKADEWAERKRLRAEEKASIQQAIATLRSDDARDLFKKSFDSHGASFVQTSALVRKVEHHPVLKNALSLLKTTAVKSGDVRLLLIAQKHAGQSMSKGDPFGPVIEDIDGFIADLKKEEEADMAEKEMCEKERAERTAKVQIHSKQIDMSTAVIGRLTEHIAASQKQVDGINSRSRRTKTPRRRRLRSVTRRRSSTARASTMTLRRARWWRTRSRSSRASTRTTSSTHPASFRFVHRRRRSLARPRRLRRARGVTRTRVPPARPAVSLLSWKGSRRTSRRISAPQTRRNLTLRRRTISSAPTSSSRFPSSRAPGPTSSR